MNHNIMNHGMRTSCLLVAGLLIATGTSAQASELIDNVPFTFNSTPFLQRKRCRNSIRHSEPWWMPG
jgi:hypothetical protein